MDEIVEHARTLIQKGSKSFAGAARLFAPEQRDSAYMLYAWCRHCDDVIDGQELGHTPASAAVTTAYGTSGAQVAAPATGEPPPDARETPAASAAAFAAAGPSAAEQQHALEGLQCQTEQALRGDAVDPVFIALSRVVDRHAIPHRHPFELLEGFRMDVEGARYTTIDDTLRYCYHVAGVVGVMMAMVMGVKARETLNRASDLGLGFQLTNIARDVIPDAQAGRVYLPAAWLEDVGVPATPEAVAAVENREAVACVVRRLLDEAERYYESARHGLPALDSRSAWAIASARHVYRDIGSLVRERGSKAWDRRAVVSRMRKRIGVAVAGGLVAHSRIGRHLGIGTLPPREGLWTMPGLGDA
ncbi:MAG: phytoene/squalene synthase family protein [Pseudomonadota bacterium]